MFVNKHLKGRVNSNSGLTLIEVLVTITILAILASAVIPLSKMTVKRTKEVELKRSLRLIRTALDEYKKTMDKLTLAKDASSSGYPETLMDLVEGIEDTSKAGVSRQIKFLRRIPKDPMSRDEYAAPEETWEIRSYDSDPDDFGGGDDVFDIRSKSYLTGLNGIPYSEW